MNESSIEKIVINAIITTGEYAQEGFRDFKAVKKVKSYKGVKGQMVYIICTKKKGFMKSEARKIETFFKLQDWGDARKLFIRLIDVVHAANDTIKEMEKQKII